MQWVFVYLLLLLFIAVLVGRLVLVLVLFLVGGLGWVVGVCGVFGVWLLGC